MNTSNKYTDAEYNEFRNILMNTLTGNTNSKIKEEINQIEILANTKNTNYDSKMPETKLDELIESANNDGSKNSNVIAIFNKSPEFSKFKKIISRGKSVKLQKLAIKEYLSDETFHDVFVYLNRNLRDDLIPELSKYIVNLTEDRLLMYLRNMSCNKMAHPFLAAYGIYKLNYRIINCIMMNKKLGKPMMTEILDICEQLANE